MWSYCFCFKHHVLEVERCLFGFCVCEAGAICCTDSSIYDIDCISIMCVLVPERGSDLLNWCYLAHKSCLRGILLQLTWISCSLFDCVDKISSLSCCVHAVVWNSEVVFPVLNQNANLIECFFPPLQSSFKHKKINCWKQLHVLCATKDLKIYMLMWESESWCRKMYVQDTKADNLLSW